MRGSILDRKISLTASPLPRWLIGRPTVSNARFTALFSLFVMLLSAFGVRAEVLHGKVASPKSPWTIDVYVMQPTGGRTPHTVVLFLPGSDGIGDNDHAFGVLSNMAGPTARRSFLPYALAARGYAYAYFNYGGIGARERCSAGVPRPQLRARFLRRCLVSRVMRRHSFADRTADVAAVRAWIGTQVALKDARVILLGLSEGGMHAARLLRADPSLADGFVALGAPTESPAANLLAQMNRTLRYRTLLAYLERTGSDRLELSRLPEIFPDDSAAVDYFRLGPLRAEPAWSKTQIETIRAMDVAFSTRAFHAAMKSIGRRPVAGEWFGKELPALYPSASFHEELADEIDMTSSLERFAGKTVFLFGEHDAQVAFSRRTACGEPQRPGCRLARVAGAGHSLIMPGNQLSTLGPILEAIEEVRTWPTGAE